MQEGTPKRSIFPLIGAHNVQEASALKTMHRMRLGKETIHV
jgi:hypothetical protein